MTMRSRGAFMLRAMLLFLAIGLATAPSVAAQRSGTRQTRSPEERAQMEERYRRQIASLIRERLGLSEAESAQLSTVARTYEQRRRALWREEQATRRRVEALLEDGPADDVAAAALLSRMAELKQEESSLFGEEQAALLEVLSPMQLIQLQELREELGRRIRRLRGGDDSERRRGSGATPERVPGALH